MCISTGVEMVLAPLAQAMGVDYQPATVQHGSPRAPKRTQVDRADPEATRRAEQRDAALLRGAGAAGIALDL